MGAKMTNLDLLMQAGINPKTKLPMKFGNKKALKENIRHIFRNIDEQDAVNRYVWYNLPMDLPSQEIERMLYYKGQLCFFYDKNLEQFYILPYALDGTIDGYGRFNTVHPIPMTSGIEDNNKHAKALADYLAGKKLKCVYGIKLPEDLTEEDFTESCVLLHDYSKQLSQVIVPRVTINEPLLDTMAECVPMMRTSLLLATGVKGMRVQDDDQAYAAVKEGSRAVEEAAMQGEAFVPVVSNIEFQELTNGPVNKSEEYMLALQSLDNLRLSSYGIDNGGLFEKKAHILQDEADVNGGPVGLILQDGLTIRQNFCNIVNSIWDLGIWCEPAENIVGADLNGDGVIYDRNEESENSGIEVEETSESEEVSENE